MDELLKKYVHQNWDDISDHRNDKYYFVQASDDMETVFSEVRYQLEAEIPETLKAFYRNFGCGFLWLNQKQKKGLYRILSPEEILDLYFEPDSGEIPDDFITYRQNAWENLEENKLLAFCLFGEEGSLLYISVEDGVIYYLSAAYKIADFLSDFLASLDQEVDYFIK
ncbi:MAG: hypothetical protein HFF43_00095 [Lawsonibacter sp.]|jgi:hypothetical protein|nr:hypothetical protein [Lawsonibacter sp.]